MDKPSNSRKKRQLSVTDSSLNETLENKSENSTFTESEPASDQDDLNYGPGNGQKNSSGNRRKGENSKNLSKTKKVVFRSRRNSNKKERKRPKRKVRKLGQLEFANNKLKQEQVKKFHEKYDLLMLNDGDTKARIFDKDVKKLAKSQNARDFFGFLVEKGGSLSENKTELKKYCCLCFINADEKCYQQSTGLSNLKYHLSHEHGIDTKSFRGSLSQIKPIDPVKMNLQSPNHRNELADAIARMVGVGLFPLNIVENQGFIEFNRFVGSIGPEEKLPTPKTIKTHVWDLYFEMKNGEYDKKFLKVYRLFITNSSKPTN